MFNKLTNELQDGFAVEQVGILDVDQRPGVRLVCLFLLVFVPALILTARLVLLQQMRSELVIKPTLQLTESLESLPARTGRILSIDGQVLAHDVDTFQIQVHYRWLEEPPNPRWLRKEVYSRLERKDRSNRELIGKTQSKILQERNKLWKRLATLTNRSLEEIEDSRERVQHRVESIAESVRVRQQKKWEQATTLVLSGEESTWERWTKRVQHALTTPPRRVLSSRLVVKEEVDFHPLVQHVPLSIAAKIETSSDDFPGCRIQVQRERVYPLKSLAAHVVGTRTRFSAEEWKQHVLQYGNQDPLDYQPDDLRGKTGIERSYERLLRGLRGEQKVVRNHRGIEVSATLQRAPLSGQDLLLTIHAKLQSEAERLLRKMLGDFPAVSQEELLPVHKRHSWQNANSPRGGCLLVMDVHNGELLVAVSAPDYDLNVHLQPNQDLWRQLNEDPRSPFFSRITGMAVPPGSFFTMVTAMAALQSGRFNNQTLFTCDGQWKTSARYRCSLFEEFGIGHGKCTLDEALNQSCKVTFYQIADEIGVQPILLWSRKCGFGQLTGIDLPFERSGFMPDLDSRETEIRSTNSPRQNNSLSARKSIWTKDEMMNLSVGESRLTITPLQMIRFTAAIANGGSLVRPHVVRRINAIADRSNIAARRMVSPRSKDPIPYLQPATIQLLQHSFKQSDSSEEKEPATDVLPQSIPVAWQSGLMKVKGSRKDHFWFTGYFPRDRPRYALLLVLEHGADFQSASRETMQSFLQTAANLLLDGTS